MMQVSDNNAAIPDYYTCTLCVQSYNVMHTVTLGYYALHTRSQEPSSKVIDYCEDWEDDHLVHLKLGQVPLIDLTWVASQITTETASIHSEPESMSRPTDYPIQNTCSNLQMNSVLKLTPDRSKKNISKRSERKAVAKPCNKVTPSCARTTPWLLHKVTPSSSKTASAAANTMAPSCSKKTAASKVAPSHLKTPAVRKMTPRHSKTTAASKATPSRCVLKTTVVSKMTPSHSVTIAASKAPSSKVTPSHSMTAARKMKPSHLKTTAASKVTSTCSKTTNASPQHKVTQSWSKQTVASPLHKVTSSSKMTTASHRDHHKVTPRPRHAISPLHQSTPCLSHTSAVLSLSQAAAPCHQQISAGSPLHKMHMSHSHSTTKIACDHPHKTAPSYSNRTAVASQMSAVSSLHHAAPLHQQITAAIPHHQQPQLHQQITAVIPLHQPAPLHPQITAVSPTHQPGTLHARVSMCPLH